MSSGPSATGDTMGTMSYVGSPSTMPPGASGCTEVSPPLYTATKAVNSTTAKTVSKCGVIFTIFTVVFTVGVAPSNQAHRTTASTTEPEQRFKRPARRYKGCRATRGWRSMYIRPAVHAPISDHDFIHVLSTYPPGKIKSILHTCKLRTRAARSLAVVFDPLSSFIIIVSML